MLCLQAATMAMTANAGWLAWLTDRLSLIALMAGHATMLVPWAVLWCLTSPYRLMNLVIKFTIDYIRNGIVFIGSCIKTLVWFSTSPITALVTICSLATTALVRGIKAAPNALWSLGCYCWATLSNGIQSAPGFLWSCLSSGIMKIYVVCCPWKTHLVNGESHSV
jgi:hypothetical protein